MKQNRPHQPRKRFGQNFLHDRNTIDNIVRSINPQAEDLLVEIGPGQGAITHLLKDRCRQLDIIEIDRDLTQQLRQQYVNIAHIHIHEIDVLKFDFKQFGMPFRIVGNLPYNISTPLLIKLINHHQQIIDAHFMLQKEVVERICAAPSNKNYGRLSVILQYHFHPSHLFNVAPAAFNPPPKVDSAIIRLQPYQQKIRALNIDAFQHLCKMAFAQRRKTLRNNLKNNYDATIVAHLELDFDLNRRPETFSVDEFVRLSNLIINYES